MEPDEARSRLDTERTRLEGAKAALDGDRLHDETAHESISELSHLAQHQADVATETFDREVEFGILDSIENELADIERALQRLDAGTYGTCEACGQTIPEERLAEMPATRFCREHQAEAERS